MTVARSEGSPDGFLVSGAWVRRLAGSLVESADAADDLAQEGWLAALRTGPRGVGPKAWWVRVLGRLASQRRLREEKQARWEQEAAQMHHAAAGRADEALDWQRRLVRLVADLRDPYRTVVVLRYYQGLPPGRIARETGVPVATVKSQIHRGLALLRARLDRGGDRASWRVPLASLASAPRHGILAMGAVIVSAKTAWVAGACVVAGLWALMRTEDVEPPRKLEGPAIAKVAREGLGRGQKPTVAAKSMASVPFEDVPGENGAEALVAKLVGRILDPKGRPVPGSSVHWWSDSTVMPSLFMTGAPPAKNAPRVIPTDRDGRFEVETASRTFVLWPTAPGHAALEWIAAQGVDPAHFGPLELRVGRARNVEVHVRDADGRSLAEIPLEFSASEASLRNRQDGSSRVEYKGAGRLLAVTGAEGWARVELTECDTWHLNVTLPEFAPAYQRVSLHVGHLDIVLEPRRVLALRGRVLDKDDRPIFGASLAVKESETRSSTDEQGRFELVPFPFLAQIGVTAQGFARTIVSTREPGAELVIRLRRGFALAGHVRDRQGVGVSGATVRVRIEDDSAADVDAPKATTSEEGSFSFEHLGGARWVVTAHDDAGETQASIRVPAGTSNVVLTLGELHVAPTRLSGIITDGLTGLPLEGVRVVANTFSGGWGQEIARTVTSKLGTYVLLHLPAECLTISAALPDYTHAMLQPREFQGESRGDFRLWPQRKIEVLVKDATGKPFAQALVSVIAETEPLSIEVAPDHYSTFLPTDAAGRTTLRGLPARRVRVFAFPNYATTTRPVEVDLSRPFVGRLELEIPIVPIAPHRPVLLTLPMNLGPTVFQLRGTGPQGEPLVHGDLRHDGKGWVLEGAIPRPVGSTLALELPHDPVTLRLTSEGFRTRELLIPFDHEADFGPTPRRVAFE